MDIRWGYTPLNYIPTIFKGQRKHSLYTRWLYIAHIIETNDDKTFVNDDGGIVDGEPKLNDMASVFWRTPPPPRGAWGRRI